MSSIVDPSLYPELNEAQRCAFCGYQGKLTQEHVWPRRFRKLVKVTGNPQHMRGSYGRGSFGADVMQTWRAAPWTARVGIDCNHCNNVRLEYIERQAIRFVGPMAFSQREGGIPVPARQWLAAFALRMVAVGQYTHAQHRPIPRRHREYLVTNQAAPPPTAVWLWRYDFDVGQLMDVNIHCASMRAIRKGEPLPAWNNAYHGLLRVGALIMEVASRTDGRGYPEEPLAPGRMIPIWPLDIGRVLSWPPAHALSQGEWTQRVLSLDDSIVI
jgi:hypothetical protein